MDQLIFASLSYTHYWYEVGMLKVTAAFYHIYYIINVIVQQTTIKYLARKKTGCE